MPITNMPLGVTAVMLPELDFDEQIALCQQLGVTHYSLRPRVIPPEQHGKPFGNWGNHKFDLTPEGLLEDARTIRQKLTDAGLTPFGTVPAAIVTDADDVLWLHFEGAAAVGSGRVRVAPPAYPKTHFDYTAELDRVVELYRHAVDLARPLGVKIVIETHSNSFATSPALAWNICRHFDPAELGVIFDVANFNIEGGINPTLAVAVLDRYIDHVHFGAAQLVPGPYDELGFRRNGRQMCPLTESNLHLPSWIAALRDAGKTAPIILESYTANVPGRDRLQEAVAAMRRIFAAL